MTKDRRSKGPMPTGLPKDGDDDDRGLVESMSEEAQREADDFLKRIERPNVVNRDNKNLHPWGPIGHVDEVNGPGAREVPEFVPTRNELLQLVKYWCGVRLDRQFFNTMAMAGDSESLRLCPFAMRRIDRIVDVCGDDAVQAYLQAEDQFAKSVDPEAWRVYRHGTPEELEAFVQKLNRSNDDDIQS